MKSFNVDPSWQEIGVVRKSYLGTIKRNTFRKTLTISEIENSDLALGVKWKYQSETVGKAIWPWAWTSTWLPLPSGQLEICQYGRKCVLLKFKIPRLQFDKIDLQCSQFRTSINWKHIARTILIGWPPPSFQEGISSRKEKLPTDTNIFQHNPHTLLHKCTGWRIFFLLIITVFFL